MFQGNFFLADACTHLHTYTYPYTHIQTHTPIHCSQTTHAAASCTHSAKSDHNTPTPLQRLLSAHCDTAATVCLGNKCKFQYGKSQKLRLRGHRKVSKCAVKQRCVLGALGGVRWAIACAPRPLARFSLQTAPAPFSQPTYRPTSPLTTRLARTDRSNAGRRYCLAGLRRALVSGSLLGWAATRARPPGRRAARGRAWALTSVAAAPRPCPLPQRRDRLHRAGLPDLQGAGAPHHQRRRAGLGPLLVRLRPNGGTTALAPQPASHAAPPPLTGSSSPPSSARSGWSTSCCAGEAAARDAGRGAVWFDPPRSNYLAAPRPRPARAPPAAADQRL